MTLQHLKDGRTLTSTKDVYRPGGDLALQRAALIRKFNSLAGPVIGAERADALRDLVLRLETLSSVKQLLAVNQQNIPALV